MLASFLSWGLVRKMGVRRRIRLVLDTNLMIAAYFNPRSASAQILDLCLKDQVLRVAFTDGMHKEAMLILRNVRAPSSFTDKINQLFERGVKVKKVNPRHLVLEDPEDNKFADCALASRSDYLITNDRHMLKLGHMAGTEVVRPTDFLKKMRREH